MKTNETHENKHERRQQAARAALQIQDNLKEEPHMMNPMKALKEYNGLARKEAKNAYLTNLQARAAAFEEAAKIVEADGEASKGTLKKLNDLAQGAKQAVSYIEDYNKD